MTGCPNDDVLGALVQRALDERELAEVTSHLDACASCRQVVIAAVRGGIAAGVPTIGVGTPTHGGPPGPLPEIRDLAGPAVGTRIGRYELRGLLGSGGMGRVYEAFDPELDRAIALKLMRPELGTQATVLAERLVRESRLMAKVVHPAVIAVHDVGRAGDAVFIAMDLIRGETLGAYVRRVKPGWREIVGLLERAGHGLAAAHATGIVHRDFKPDNVLVELDAGAPSRVVVTDFGVARAFADDPTAPGPHPTAATRAVELTATGTAIGTPAYMAPEQLDGQTIDQRADVFAFAVSAWELLFGQRPFAGTTAGELRAAIARSNDPGAARWRLLRSALGIGRSPRPPRGHRLPARVIRTLERGLAVAPADRWPDLAAMLRGLAGSTMRRRRVVAAAAAIGLVGGGLVGARVLAAPASDPCDAGRAAIASAYDDARAAMVRATLGGDPKLRDMVLAKLDQTAAAWRDTHAATCHGDAEPIQPAMTSACLDARRLELAGFVDDVLADARAAVTYARPLIRVVGDPARCATPAPGLVAARVPVDPALRARVTALRYQAFDADAARDRGDFAFAIERASAVVAASAKLWPPLHAEAMYLLGGAQSFGGDNAKGMATLKEAAALAERAHHDYVAANVWIQLAMSAAFDAGDPARALEYVAYAEAAIDRVGRPSDVVTSLEYIRGTSLIEADRSNEGEVALRKALALAETTTPTLLPHVIQGLGYLYEDQGRFPEAVEAYRRALVKLAALGPVVPATEVMFRQRLSSSLGFAGQYREAELEARTAVALADRVMSASNLDRAAAHVTLGQVLQRQGKRDAALREAEAGLAAIRNILGERSERYGEALRFTASVLVDLGRYDDAASRFARACDIIAFGTGEGASAQAECWLDQAGALSELGRAGEALVLADKALPVLVKAFGDSHPQVANGYVTRGTLKVKLGRPDAIPDLEQAVKLFGDRVLDAGHLAAAKWALGKALWTQQPARARTLVEQAVARFATAAASWDPTRRDATAWLAAHP